MSNEVDNVNNDKHEEAPVFASEDVREKAKIIEQARQKSFGDFLITSKPKQGQLKKKKKKEKLEDNALKSRGSGI